MIDYDKLLDEWAEKVFKKADEARDRYEEEDVGTTRSSYCRGYMEGLLMATAILSRMEKKARGKGR